MRPVTIKQLVEASATNGDGFAVQSYGGKLVDIGQVVFVACVRSVRESEASTDYIFEDGTGSIPGKCWQDRISAVAT